MTDSEAARAAIGALPPTAPHAGEASEAPQTESASAPTDLSAELQGAVAGLDPFAFVGTIKTLVNLGTKVLGLVAKFPGPQQGAAQELLKVLDEVSSILNRIP